jgi:hypothetical protein
MRLLLEIGGESGVAVLSDDLNTQTPSRCNSCNIWRHQSATSPSPYSERSAPQRQSIAAELRSLERRGRAGALDIEPLSRSGATTMIEALLEASPSDEMVTDIMRWTDENPLLIEEVLQAHLTAGTLRLDGHSIEWSGWTRAIVPRTIAEIVRQKLAAVTSDARRVINGAAVLGGFDSDLLMAICAIDTEALSAALRQGIGARSIALAGPRRRKPPWIARLEIAMPTVVHSHRQSQLIGKALAR